MGASYFLYEWDTGHRGPPASEEDCRAYTQALQSGNQWIEKGWHGKTMKYIVSKAAPIRVNGSPVD